MNKGFAKAQPSSARVVSTLALTNRLNEFVVEQDQHLPVLPTLTPEAIACASRAGLAFLEWRKVSIVRANEALYTQLIAADPDASRVHQKAVSFARRDAEAVLAKLQSLPVEVRLNMPGTGLVENWMGQGEHLLFMKEHFGLAPKINPAFTRAKFYTVVYYLDLYLKPGNYELVA